MAPPAFVVSYSLWKPQQEMNNSTMMRFDKKLFYGFCDKKVKFRYSEKTTKFEEIPNYI